MLSTLLRATTLPIFNGATGNPLDLAPKGGLSDRMHEFVIPGMSSDLKRSEIELTIRMAGLQAQSIIGPQVLSSLMEVQIFEGVSLFIAGDSIYYLVENDLTEELIMKRTDVVREMCQGSKLEDKLNALDATITKEFAGRQSALADALLKTTFAEDGEEAQPKPQKRKLEDVVTDACKGLPEWISRLLLSFPVTAGATDTSTSDLIIQPASICITKQLWKSVLSGVDRDQEALTRLWVNHIKTAHQPPVAIPGLSTLVRMGVLASGAYSHEVSTSVTSFLAFARCLQLCPPPWAAGPSEFLVSLNRSLPQGLSESELNGDIPVGVATDAFLNGGFKVLGLTMSVFPEIEAAMLKWDADIPLTVSKVAERGLRHLTHVVSIVVEGSPRGHRAHGQDVEEPRAPALSRE